VKADGIANANANANANARMSMNPSTRSLSKKRSA